MNGQNETEQEGRIERLVGWQPIETAPTTEDVSFLVLMGKNSAASFLVVQVYKFEGYMYPDQMDCNIDWHDRITTATHWMPLLLPANAQVNSPFGAQKKPNG